MAKKGKEKKRNPKEIAKTVQQLLPVLKTFPGGIIQSTPTTYSKLYQFQDANFVVETEDKQIDTIIRYSKLLNHFQTNVSLELIIVNERVPEAVLQESFHIPLQGKDTDIYREEYNHIIDERIKDGRNDIRKKKYFLVNVEADDFEAAKGTFITIDTELSSAVQEINRTGVKALTMEERLELMDTIFKGVTLVPFKERTSGLFLDGELLDKDLKKTGQTVRDLVAPDYIESCDNAGDKGKIGDMLRIGDARYCKTMMFTTLPPSLDTKFLTEITNVPCEMVTTVLFKPVPRNKAVRMVKERNSAIKADILKSSKSALQNGYDPEYTLSEELLESREEAAQMRKEIISEGKKIFFATITSTFFATSEKDLADFKGQYEMRCADFSALPNSLFGQQKAGLITAALTGSNTLCRDVMLTSDSACALFPFNIQELMDNHGHFYGINPISKNMVMYNRRTSDLPNGIILGRSGSGKSFITKGEIIPNLLDGEDDVIILDPDGEYVAIAKAFGGTVIDLERKSDTHINPCDMSMEFGNDRAEPLAEKCDYMVSLVESILGNRRECNAFEVNVIHRATKKMYEEYIDYMEKLHEAGGKQDLDEERCPTLENFYEELVNDGSPEGGKIAMAIQPYCIGQYNLFAHKTNITNRPRFMVYNLKNLPKKMKEMAMTVCLSNIWTRASENKEAKKATWIYLDEFYLLCQTENSATTLQTFFKRIRKYFGIMTGITQDVSDLTSTKQGLGMIENAGFLLIMNQSPTGRDIVKHRYEVPDAMVEYIKDKPPGNGLIYTGTTMIPFNYRLPTNTELYKLMSTKPAEE